MSENKFKTPWTYSGQKGKPKHCYVAQIWDINEEGIANIDVTEDATDANATAAHIVHCVNLHDELVAVLGELKHSYRLVIMPTILQEKIDSVLTKAKQLKSNHI